MSDLVGNPEDRFSQNEAQLQVMLNDGEFYVSYEDMPAKVKQNYPETLFPLPDTEAADWGSDMWYVPLQITMIAVQQLPQVCTLHVVKRGEIWG